MMARHQRDNRPLTYSSETGKCYADDDLLPQEADLVFEAELLRNPNLPSLWSRYLDARKDAPREDVRPADREERHGRLRRAK